MSTYVVLMKLSEHGVKNVKDAPARIDRTIRDFEAAGGQLLDFYVLMGPYDFFCAVEGPSDEAIVSFAFQVSAAGNVKTTLLKAYSREQFAGMVQNLDKGEKG
jgi:uncharacterized protein with GYD domain